MKALGIGTLLACRPTIDVPPNDLRRPTTRSLEACMTVPSLSRGRTIYMAAVNPKGVAIGGGTDEMSEWLMQSLGVCMPVPA
jgi:hypothetical protein